MYIEKVETTLDLIEECLEQIYNVRKRSLDIRIRRNKAKQLLEDEEAAKLSTNKVTESKILEEESGDENDVLAFELSQRLKVPTSIPPNNIPSKPLLKKISSISAITSSKEKAKLPTPAELFDGFVAEYNLFVRHAHNSNEPLDEDEIETECELLTEKYFNNGLDQLPNSAEVTMVKNKISSHLERLASGVFNRIQESVKAPIITSDYNTNDGVEDTYDSMMKAKSFDEITGGEKEIKLPPSPAKKKSVKFKEAQSAGEACAEPPKDEINNNALVKAGTAAPVDKAAAEKLRIKQQYENYMKMKRRSDVHPDNKKVKEYEDLNTEIESLLGSIQTIKQS